MNINDVKNLMKEAGWGTLGTTDGRKVGVRPMAGWAWVDDELWCASGKTSDKIDQLSKVPHAEYCFGKHEGQHVRIAGPCTVSTDNDDKRKLYQIVPMLKNYIKDATDPEYVIIRMKPERIRMMASPDLEYVEIKL